MNQYIIPAPMLTSISWSASNDAFVQWLKQKVSWNLEGTSPALRAVDTIITSATSVAPGHFPLVAPTPAPAPGATPAPTPIPTPGFEFDVRTTANPSATSNAGWNFPSDNSGFGERKFNHVIDGTTYPAPVALFFPATGFQHPNGGPIGYDVTPLLDSSGNPVHNNSGNVVTVADTSRQIPTPNYIYYYSKEYSAPWGTEVRFWNKGSSQYSFGDNFVKVGTDSHGLSDAAEYGIVDSDGGIDTDMFALVLDSATGEKVLRWVGGQKIRGLDLYARNVFHECVHKRLYMYRQSANIPDNDGDGLPDNEDTDNDGLPDSLEKQMGTRSDKDNSVPWGNAYGGYSDQETFCRMCERDLPVSDIDWADDGFNFGRPIAPNRQKRVVDYFWSGYSRDSLQWVDARSMVPVVP